MTAAGTVPHLLFSTRSRNPTGGAESVREVIAASPGVPEAAQREFAGRADLGGSVLHADLGGPVYTFSPAGDGTFLFCRAVSLGRYRKGAHHFLVQGLLLTRRQLAWLDGNPLVLARGDLSGAHGIEWIEEHPGEGARLAPLTLDPAIAERAAALDRRRFEELAAQPPVGDAAFPAVYAALTHGERVACVAASPTAAWVEWVLLHLHPLDRPEVSFHTWYSHGRAVPYRLMLTTDQEASRVRGQFRGLRLVDLGAAAPDPAGDRARALRRGSPDRYRKTLAEFHMTFLAEKPQRRLEDWEVVLCLRDALGEPLTAEEREHVDRLRRRSDPNAGLHHAVEDLAAVWRRGGDLAAASRETAVALEIEPAAVEAVAAVLGRSEDADSSLDPAERIAFLALLDAAAAAQPRLAARRVPAWRLLVARGTLPRLLAAVSERAEAAAVLDPFVVAAAEAEAEEEAAPAPPGEPDWRRYLSWRIGRLPSKPLAARLEQIAVALPAPRAVRWLALLGEVHAQADRPAEAVRIWLEGECRRLPEPARQERVSEAVRFALEHSVPGLEDHLRDPQLGEAVAAAVGAWVARHPSPAAAWERLRALLLGWRIDAAAAPGFAALLAGLIASPAVDRIPEVVELVLERMPRGSDDDADRRFLGRVLAQAAPRLVPHAEAAGAPALWRALVAGTRELVALRTRFPAAETAAADGALLHLVQRAVVLARALEERGRAVDRFRTVWTSWLPSVLQWEGGTARLDPAAADDWIDLLAADLRRHPPPAAADPRCRFLLTLAWRRWAEEPDTLRRLRLRLALARSRVDVEDEWHRELVAAAVPPERLPEAARLSGIPGRLSRRGRGERLWRREAR